MDFSVFMEHAVTVLGSVSGTDGGGGVLLTWPTTRETGVACLINAPMLGESERFAQTQLIGPVVVATYYSGVQRGDKLVVTAGPPYVGAQLHVTGIKMQPGLDFLAIDDLYHVEAEHVL